MEANEGIESYELLLAVCREKGVELVVGYKQMRDLLERICRSEMQNESLQMTDLSARISFVGAKTGLTYAEQNRLHTFRLTSNRVLNHQLVPTRENLLRDVKTLAFLIRKLSGEDVPVELYRLLPVPMQLIWLHLLPLNVCNGCASAFSMPMNNIYM